MPYRVVPVSAPPMLGTFCPAARLGKIEPCIFTTGSVVGLLSGQSSLPRNPGTTINVEAVLVEITSSKTMFLGVSELIFNTRPKVAVAAI